MDVDFGDVPAWGAALVAIGAAVVSGVYARKSSGSAGRSAAADEKMLHHTQTPQFAAQIENVNGDDAGLGGWSRLILELLEPVDLDTVRVELLTEGVSFTSGQYGVTGHDFPPARGAVYAGDAGEVLPLAVGDRARWRVAFEGCEAGTDEYPPVERVKLRVVATAGRSTWKVLVEAPVEALEKRAAAGRLAADLMNLGRRRVL